MSRIKKEYRDILEKIPEDKRYIGKQLIDELDFMNETLENLKTQIRANGEVEHFKQGKQEFDRESPALTSYNKVVQRYSVLYRQLTDLMAKGFEAEMSNAVYDFLKESEA